MRGQKSQKFDDKRQSWDRRKEDRREGERRVSNRRKGDRRVAHRRFDLCPSCGGVLTPTSYCPTCKARVVKVRG